MHDVCQRSSRVDTRRGGLGPNAKQSIEVVGINLVTQLWRHANQQHSLQSRSVFFALIWGGSVRLDVRFGRYVYSNDHVPASANAVSVDSLDVELLSRDG